jgi:putative membrane protein
MPDAGEPRKATNEEFKLMLQLETSLLGWLRTSLALMGFGFVIARFGLFLRELAGAAQIGVPSHPWLGRVNTGAGTGLILLGVGVMLIAIRNHQRTVDQVARGELAFPPRWSLSVVICLVLCALGMGLATYLSLV